MILVRFKLVDFGLAQTEPSYKTHAEPGKGEHCGKMNILQFLIISHINVTIAILKGPINESIGSVMPSRAIRMSPRLAKKRNSQLGLSTSTTLKSHKKENTVIVGISGVQSCNQQPLPLTASSSRGRHSRTLVSMPRYTRTSRRGSSICNHSSAEVCNHCIQR